MRGGEAQGATTGRLVCLGVVIPVDPGFRLPATSTPYAPGAPRGNLAINRGKAKEALARKLGADEYIDSDDGSAGEALARLGGATVALSTVGSSAAQVDVSLGLKPNGRLVFVATDHQPLGISPDLLVFGRRSVAGWYGGNAKDNEDTMAFAARKGTPPMARNPPPAQAEETCQDIRKAGV